MREAVPSTTGTVRVHGCDASIEIVRDRYGIPHVRAGSEHDAFFAQGFAHAQDRLWQMSFDRMRAAGRLSECVGQPGVTFDVFVRRMGLGTAARADYLSLDAEARAPLDAYAAGVNAFIGSGAPLPAEMTMLGIAPEPWEPWHSAAVLKVRHLLMGTIGPKLWRARALRALGPEATIALASADTREELLIVPVGERRLWETDASELLAAAEAIGDGSNSWAVHGSRTASGKPLLAGDPHRILEAPNVYYQNHVSCPAFDAIGLSMPGVPGMFHFGHNGAVAWCITHAMADSHDLYVERFRADGAYEWKGDWLTAERREETIEVRGGAPVRTAVVVTRHGPIVAGDPSSGTAIALRWIGTDEPNGSLGVVRPMLSATTVEEMDEAMRPWVDPCNCMVTADVGGSIGYVHRGRVPVRPASNGWGPVAGWTGEHEWESDVPFEEVPRLRNPETGFIVTANNRVCGPDYPHYLGTDYSAPNRALRILDRLSALERATVEDMTSIHADERSLSAPAFVDLVGRAAPPAETDAAAERARRLLLDWDGVMRADDAAPLVFARLREELAALLLEREPLARMRDNPYAEEPYATPALARVRSALPRLIAVRDTAFLDGATWEELAGVALARTAGWLTETFGDDPGEWQWGRAHLTQARHPLSRSFPEAAPFLDPPVLSVGGDGDTVHAGSTDLGHGVLHSSVARYAFDLADWDNSGWVVPMGSSGHAGSPHYADQARAWAEVALVPMTYSWERIEADAESRQVLEPR